MALKISEESKVQMPMKTVLSLLSMVAIGTWAYFGVIERLNTIENKLILMETDLGMNTEFRIKWPRGEMGSLPADSEQFMMIEHLASELEKLAENIESGNAPHDQQQKLVLEFYDRRLTKIEDNIEKLVNQDD